jgi:alpha-D-ribose 1-methylphosphonate 5-triphosphate synthase subunit PhnG
MTTENLSDSSGSCTRQEVLALLARASAEELSTALQAGWADIKTQDLKAPEIGMVMVRGRVYGDGPPFNLGEATVTRSVVQIASGARGYGQRLGREPKSARMAAILDALWQDRAHRDEVERLVLSPVRARLNAARLRSQAETAATKVDFFTLVRGDPGA